MIIALTEPNKYETKKPLEKLLISKERSETDECRMSPLSRGRCKEEEEVSVDR
jgi:hypothetical protein